MAEHTNERGIDLRELFDILLSKLVWILLATFLLGFAAWFYSTQMATPLYTSRVTMCVFSDTNRGSEETAITYNELYASQMLVGTYVGVLNSNSVRQQIVDSLGLHCTAGQLGSCITAAAVDETEILSVDVTYPDPVMAQKIANEITRVFPKEIKRVVKAGGIEVVDEAKLPASPSSPNVPRNVILGAVLGFILSFAAFVVAEVTNNRVRSDEDLTKNFALPILGSIPRIDISNKEEHHEHSQKKG